MGGIVIAGADGVDNDTFWTTAAGLGTTAGDSSLVKRRSPALGRDNGGTKTLEDVVCTRLVRLPSWFTMAQAARVAELRGVEHVLVEEQGRVRGFVDRRALREGRPHDTLARWMNRSETFAEPHMSVAEARMLMRREGQSCLLVARGGILIGTVSEDDLDSFGDDRRAA